MECSGRTCRATELVQVAIGGLNLPATCQVSTLVDKLVILPRKGKESLVRAKPQHRRDSQEEDIRGRLTEDLAHKELNLSPQVARLTEN